MGREIIRQNIVDKVVQIAAGFVDPAGAYDLKLEFDNRLTVDTATQSDPWLMVRVKFLDAHQMELSDNPHHRFLGQIELAGVVKEGAGSAAAYRLTDYFYPRIHRSAFGVVRTQMADTGPMAPHLGWCYYPMLIPFWSDQNG